MSGEVWTQVYDRLAELVREHRTTLVFVNTRRLAERLARHISERVGEEQCGRASRQPRPRPAARRRAAPEARRARRRWWRPPPSSSASTSAMSISCARSAPPARSTPSCSASAAPGTRSAAISKGRLFPAVARRAGRSAPRCSMPCGAASSTGSVVPQNALDVLTQQIAAEVSAREWQEGALFELVRGAYCYRDLEREEFDECVAMLARGLQHAPRPARRAHPSRRRPPDAAAPQAAAA